MIHSSELIRRMPKAELHIHLEGSIAPETLLRLCERHGRTPPAPDVDGLREWFKFRDFPHFVEVYVTISELLRTAEDFSLVAYELGADMQCQQIRYREVTVTPYTHVWQDKGVTAEMILEGLEDGRARARRDFGVEMRWIPDIPRNLPEPAATQTADWAIAWMDRGVVALGLGGYEVGAPPEPFAGAFARARAAGLHSAPHAGETEGPASIWGALRALQAERIGHGVRCIEDPSLMDYLRAEQVPLEVNPTSNICLKLFPSIAQHPIRQLFEAGLYVTVNSDDPPLFNIKLTDEYQLLADVHGFTMDELFQLSLNAVRASFLTDVAKQAMEQRFVAEFAALKEGD